MRHIVTDKPKIIAEPNTSVQIFIQNQGPHRVQIRPHYGQHGTGTFLCSGDILIMAFQYPIIPVVRVIATCDPPVDPHDPPKEGVLDVQFWPY